MVIIFTLQSMYSGATYVAGPFDISGTTSGGVTTLLGNNISKADLLTGVTISDIDDATTGGTIQSVDGVCGNSIQWLSTGNQPTPTPTPTNQTYTFQAYCSLDSQLHPIGNAPTFVIFSESELGFIPVQGVDYVRIAGSPNVDYIFEFNGDLGQPESAHTFIERLGIGEFNCDGGAI